MQLKDERAADRPFYFIVVLWGERFRNYFLDLCLPTLLAPGNLPVLGKSARSKFLICTTPEDWKAISETPIFTALKQCIEPVLIEIPLPAENVVPCMHMGVGHRRACQLAYDNKAFPFVVTPDSMFSDGMVLRLRELARKGTELVLVPALRFAEEPLFEGLLKKGISPCGRNGSADPISLSARELAALCLPSMHSETQSYEWNAPYFHGTPSAIWWRVPSGNGIVLHCLSWAPLLFDFSTVTTHDTTVFDNWTFDGDYVYKNLGNIKKVHLVLDSDEIFIASWAPLNDKRIDLQPKASLQMGWISELLKRVSFHEYFYSGLFDPLKQTIFFAPIRWHSADIENRKWSLTEKKAFRAITKSIGMPDPISQAGVISGDLVIPSLHSGANLTVGLGGRKVAPYSIKIVAIFYKLYRPFSIVTLAWNYRIALTERLLQAAKGDRHARKRLQWRLKQLWLRVMGRPYNIPEP